MLLVPKASIAAELIAVSTTAVVYLYDVTGTQLRSVNVPYPGEPRPGTEQVRDILLNESGSLFVYNGTFDPYLSHLQRGRNTGDHITHSGWSTVGNLSSGGIGRFGQYVYVTDMRTFSEPEDAESGIVRFDVTNLTSARFASGIEFVDLNVGLDGFLYALCSNERTVNVYDPLTMALVRALALETPGVSGIAVDPAGQIFAASFFGTIYHFDSDGSLVDSITSGTRELLDIDVSATAQLIVGGRYSDVILLDEDLNILNSFVVGDHENFVTFVTQGS